MSETFASINSLAFMGALLVVAVALRARFTWLQKALLPASLIGGAIGFVLITSGLSFGFRSEDYVDPAFHFFTLSFMSLLLTGSEEGPTESAAPGGWWMTIGWVTVFVAQGLIGLAVLTVYGGVGSGQLSGFLGLLAPLGFAQGPGQAVATGAQWQSEFGVDLAVSAFGRGGVSQESAWRDAAATRPLYEGRPGFGSGRMDSPGPGGLSFARLRTRISAARDPATACRPARRTSGRRK